MISFKSFVHGIHDAVLTVNKGLAENHLKLLDQYFKTDTGDPVSLDKDQNLVPKTVTMQYPQHTAKGVETVNVEVPLITLIPIEMAQIEQVKLDMDLELQLVDKKVHVGFSKKRRIVKRGLFGKKTQPTSTSGNIEIILKPQEGPEGLQDVIEGYEKELRAQIPG